MVWVSRKGKRLLGVWFSNEPFSVLQLKPCRPTLTASSQGTNVKVLPEFHCLGLKEWTAEEMEGKNLVEGVTMMEGLVSCSY